VTRWSFCELIDWAAWYVSHIALFAKCAFWQLQHLEIVWLHDCLSLHVDNWHLCFHVKWFRSQNKHLDDLLHLFCKCSNVWHLWHWSLDRYLIVWYVDLAARTRFSDVFVLRLRFWRSVSSKHDSFLLYFHLLIIISSWLSASIQNCTSLARFSDISFRSSCWRYRFSDCVSLSCIIFHSSWYFWLRIYAFIYLFASVELSRCISLKSLEQYCYLFVF